MNGGSSDGSAPKCSSHYLNIRVALSVLERTPIGLHYFHNCRRLDFIFEEMLKESIRMTAKIVCASRGRRGLMSGPLGVLALFIFEAGVLGCGNDADPNVVVNEPQVIAQLADENIEQSVRPNEEKLNVLWIVIDSLRPDHLGTYGYPKSTSPNIDAFAKTGVVFEDCFAQGPCTWLSLQSYMTGRHFPLDHVGYGGWRTQSRIPPPQEILFAQVMEQNGYKTVCVASNPFCHASLRLGGSFETTYLVRDSGKAYGESESLNAQIFEWLDENREDPFFMYVHTMDVHTPHYRHEGYEMWEDERHASSPRPNRPPYSDEDQSWLRGEYDSSVRYADDGFREILAYLEAHELLENTIVIIGADHADVLGEGGQVYGHPPLEWSDNLLRVPLIVAGPGIKSGHRVKGLTENTDIIPTLMDSLKIGSDAKLDGISQIAALSGEPDAAFREYVFARCTYAQRSIDLVPVIMLRDNKYKYIWDPVAETETIFAVPDRLESREDVTSSVSEQELARMRAHLNDIEMPLWNEYAELPRTEVRVFREDVTAAALLNDVSPAEAFVAKLNTPGYRSASETKWTFTIRYLVSAGWIDAPPVTLRFDVPNGTYDVQLRALLGTIDGKEGSSFRLKAQDDASFQTIAPTNEVLAAAKLKGSSAVRLPIGIYEVANNEFVLTLDEGDPKMWAICRSVHFVRVDEESDIETSEDDREEQLGALGYLD